MALEFRGGMSLTRTERLLLELVAERHGLALSPPEPPPGVRERPQLAEWLVAEGHLTEAEVEQALELVFDAVRAEADRLAPPRPAPVPRQPEPGSAAELEALVDRLAGVLERLVEGGSPTQAREVLPAGPDDRTLMAGVDATDGGTLIAPRGPGAAPTLIGGTTTREQLESAATLLPGDTSTQRPNGAAHPPSSGGTLVALADATVRAPRPAVEG